MADDLNAMTKAELLDEADRRGVDANESNTKQEIIDALNASGGGSGGSGDDAAAERAGMSEGELRALRDDAGINLLPGHEGTVHQWENSPEGKEWLEGAKKREEAEKKATEAAEASATEVQEATDKYLDAVSGKKSSTKK